MAQESHQGGSESDCMSGHMGHKPAINVPDFLPAMQKALYVRLSQKHQRDGDSVSSQGQRAMSKEEGRVNFLHVQNLLVDSMLFWSKCVELNFHHVTICCDCECTSTKSIFSGRAKYLLFFPAHSRLDSELVLDWF